MSMPHLACPILTLVSIRVRCSAIGPKPLSMSPRAGALLGKSCDSNYVSAFLNARGPALVDGEAVTRRQIGYFKNANLADPLVWLRSRGDGIVILGVCRVIDATNSKSPRRIGLM